MEEAPLTGEPPRGPERETFSAAAWASCPPRCMAEGMAGQHKTLPGINFSHVFRLWYAQHAHIYLHESLVAHRKLALSSP
jgi:hypothetical protein